MITQQIEPSDSISIVPPRIAEAESRMSLDQLRARFARNEGLPFADVLTEPRIRDALDEHGAPLPRPGVQPHHDHLGLPLAGPQRRPLPAATPWARIIAHRAAGGLETCSPNTASYCNARGRLSHGRPEHLGAAGPRGVAGRGRSGVEMERAG